jgi:hypothetical protein
MSDPAKLALKTTAGQRGIWPLRHLNGFNDQDLIDDIDTLLAANEQLSKARDEKELAANTYWEGLLRRGNERDALKAALEEVVRRCSTTYVPFRPEQVSAIGLFVNEALAAIAKAPATK